MCGLGPPDAAAASISCCCLLSLSLSWEPTLTYLLEKFLSDIVLEALEAEEWCDLALSWWSPGRPGLCLSLMDLCADLLLDPLL